MSYSLVATFGTTLLAVSLMGCSNVGLDENNISKTLDENAPSHEGTYLAHFACIC